MGSAIIEGLIKSGYTSADKIIVYDGSPSVLERLHKNFGIRKARDNPHVVSEADIVFLAVKPNVFPVVTEQICDLVTESTLIISIAAGTSLGTIASMFDKPVKLIRTMPNTPALVGAAMTAICPNEHVTKDELSETVTIFKSVGEAEVVREEMFDAVTAVSGSSPAYVFILIEAMADAAVLEGMPRTQAYRFAAQAVLGSAKMLLDKEIHPAALKDMVCSPGGTTIEAVAVLEQEGFRNAVISAMRACSTKSARLGVKNVSETRD